MSLRLSGSPREPGICHLNKIPIEECGEPLVNIRETCAGLKVKANPSLLRLTTARMLQKAQSALPAGYGFKVNSALRTHERQTRGYTEHLEKLREAHPEWPLSVLRRQANKFWHPPDQKAPPGHCTGGAVDVTLVKPDGTEFDMNSTVREGVDSNPTYSRWLTEEANSNRQILIGAMTAAGFSNCADEWWHWSYGDNGWAARLGVQPAIYGAVTVSEEELKAATVEEEAPPA
ncbi:MAG: dipeptidase [Armatimonadota bacterium]|nr:dipeptidase [Armatimonadota bacterium]